jgi:SOS response regulatory protein OraA/RecX
MASAGYRAAQIAETLSYLDERGYLNDAAFARDIARAASERKNWGPARVEQKLKALKLPEDAIQEALSESFPEGEEEVSARRALEKFEKRIRAVGERGRARAYRHLLRRGFSPDLAHRLVSTRDFGDTGR